MTRVLVSDRAYGTFSTRLGQLEIPVTWVRVVEGGELLVDGAPTTPQLARPEVGWMTSDLFFGGPAEAFFEAALSSGSVRWVQSPAAGVDLPVYRRLFDRDIRLTISHTNSPTIAEYVLGAVLRLYQQPERWQADQSARRWCHHEFREILGTTWLIVGLGAIGREVAERARAFGATVIGVRRSATGDEPVDELWQPGDLSEPLGRSDVVVICAPATPETESLVGDRFLAAMREDAVLVNVARGALLDEAALLRSLDRGRPGHAVLDVFATEPLPAESPLWSHPKVTVTPHNAAGAVSRHDRQVELFLDNLHRYLTGQELVYEITASDLP